VPSYQPTEAFRFARDFLLTHAEDYEVAVRDFRWPLPGHFNWAIDWFDKVLAVEHAHDPALRLVRGDGSSAYTFAELSHGSTVAAARLRYLGVRRGDRVLVMLDNQPELWESYLALMKLGAVIVPLAPHLGAAHCRGIIGCAGVAHVLAGSGHAPKFRHVDGDWTPIAVGADVEGWQRYQDDGPVEPVVPFTLEPTEPDDLLFLFTTPGTTGKPKLVAQPHGSYPVGHLSTMYWIGLRPGDVHLSVAVPGWAKHVLSNLFAPWNAAACVLVCPDPKLTPAELPGLLDRYDVTTMCAPPGAWANLAAVDNLAAHRPARLREVVTIGEPLSPLVLDRIRQAWNLVVREGYGQSEVSTIVGHPPGKPVMFRSLGRPLPGQPVVLVDIDGDDPVAPGEVGEICLELGAGVPITTGYPRDPERSAECFRGGRYHTGDLAVADERGFLTWLGPVGDVFWSDGAWISPSDLEAVVAEHEAVAEVGVVGRHPDENSGARDLRSLLPWQRTESPLETKAYVVLRPGQQRSAVLARTILADAAGRMPPTRRIRCLEFVDELPRSASATLRRYALRSRPPGVEYRVR
jgi:acetyl-CoA synthetase